MDADFDWTRGYFEPPYEELHPFPDATRTDEEVASLVALLPGPPARILDVGCGQGRHALRLAQRGFDVVGIDTSARFLAAARAAATSLDNATFVEQDARGLDFVEAFDAALSVFSSWGYFDDDTNQDVLSRIARALRPGGRFVLELLPRDALMRVFTPKDWIQLTDGRFAVVERTFDPVDGAAVVTNRWHTAAGELVERSHRIRVYTATELDRVLRAVGLRPTKWFNGLSLEPLTYWSRRLLVVAERD